MPLIAGTRLGPYEIVSPIGKGGMGEVYRARDTKLERDVAIKVLPEELAQNEERRARFEREAKLLASLNHPNIASIYGAEEAEGVTALVLELVEGLTLAERIRQAPIPLQEALAIAKQIAEALEAGHEAGVIHRDLKPANIKLKEDGTLKVLDYGLAKALEGDTPGGGDSELSQSPTLTRQGTQVGVILGTAAYMSPEQAKGKRVDKRADVWAFGAVLYEMLTGKRAFEAEDVSDTLAAVLRAEPDWNAVPPEVSPTLRSYLSRCLEKNPKERVRDIGDVRLAMDGAFEASAVPREDLRSSPRSTQGWMVAGAALLVAAFLGVGWWSATSDVAPRVARFVIESPPPPSTLAEVALTPDGANLVYRNDGAGIENDRIAVRALNALEEAHVQIDSPFPSFFLSPDGEWIGYFGRGVLQKVSILGGPLVTICPLPPGVARGASWGANDTIIFAMNTGLWRVSAGGGEPEVLTASCGQAPEPNGGLQRACADVATNLNH